MKANVPYVPSPRTFHRIVLLAIFGALSFIGSALFFLAWPAAIILGLAFGRVRESTDTPRGSFEVILWSALSVFAGQVPAWIFWARSPLFSRPLLWMLLGPAITALLFAAGVTYSLANRTIRQRTAGGTTPPTSGDHGSSAQPHKHNPTPHERGNGHMRVVITHT